MKYDVIISSYNGQCYIREQIESISNQIPSPEKIIIRDDGSTDLTISEINSFIDDNKLHSKIIVKSGKNLGYIKSFEALLSSCTEEVVFFSDQDDVWLPGKAKLILDALKEPSVNLVFTNAHVTDSKLEIKNELVNSSKAKYGLYDLLHTNIVTGATVAAKVNFIKNNCLPFLDSVPHDFQMACKSAQLNSLKFINEHTILYRQHENNQIGASKKNLISRICRNFTYSAYLRRKKELSY
ncbi:glycosyltransferase, partial [Vibrio cyclitrophicus]